jgi:hypothetical protein
MSLGLYPKAGQLFFKALGRKKTLHAHRGAGQCLLLWCNLGACFQCGTEIPRCPRCAGLVNACIRVGKDKEALSRAKQALMSMPSQCPGCLD